MPRLSFARSGDGPKYSPAKSFSAFLLSIFTLTLPRPIYSQTAHFHSYICDTNINTCLTTSPDDRNIYAAGPYTMTVFQRRLDGALTISQVLNNDHNGIAGIHQVMDMAVSPDALYLYAVVPVKQSLLIFARDATDGQISLVEIFRDSDLASEHGEDPVREFSYKLIMSPDGRHLYWLYAPTTNNPHSKIVGFSRDLITGRVAKIQTLKNTSLELQQNRIPSSLAISPDGKNLYGAGYNHALLVFSRNQVTGHLKFEESVNESPFLRSTWLESSVMVSFDGTSIYATNLYSNILMVFSRNTDNGKLTPVEYLVLYQPLVVFGSSDDKNVYVRAAGGMAIYDRAPLNGQLSLVEFDRSLAVDIQMPAGLAVSSHGSSIYALYEGTLTHMQRDTLTGKLSIQNRLNDNNLGGTDRLLGSRAVEVSPDGRFAYVAARFEDAGISTFARQQDDGTLSLVASDALASLNAMVMAPDGRHLYVSSFEKGTLTAFAIDPARGDFQLVQSRQDSLVVPTYLEWGAAMVFSRDGSHLYLNDKMFLRVYHRNHHTGEISLVQKLDCRPYGLFEIVSLTLSPAGRNFYCNHVDNDLLQKIATFVRNPQTGELSFHSKLTFSNVGDWGAMGIKVSPDGRHVYAATIIAPYSDSDGYAGILILARDATSGALT